MSDRHELRVSCKAALFTEDLSEVLLAEYEPGHYGLPGGHIEPGDETPDAAIARELDEEFGLKSVELQRKDFWVHHNGKLILGYMGIIGKDTPIRVQVEELYDASWQPVHDIASGHITVRSYGEFILRCAGLSEDAGAQFSVPAQQTDRQ